MAHFSSSSSSLAASSASDSLINALQTSFGANQSLQLEVSSGSCLLHLVLWHLLSILTLYFPDNLVSTATGKFTLFLLN